jgi:hypothetical protein
VIPRQNLTAEQAEQLLVEMETLHKNASSKIHQFSSSGEGQGEPATKDYRAFDIAFYKFTEMPWP